MIGKGEEWEREVCVDCEGELEWVECGDCEDGYTYHDCGEDTCCCRYPENNVACDTCEGQGGWYSCLAECWKRKEDIEGIT